MVSPQLQIESSERSSWDFRPGALWECCGTPYLRARRCAAASGGKKASDAFSAVRGLGGLYSWSVDGDTESQRRAVGFQQDKNSCLVSINTIINISHLLNNNEDVWRYLAPVCKNKTFCYIGEYEFSVDWAKSRMLDCLETWAVSNHSHMFSNVFLSLNVCFPVSRSSAAEVCRSRTAQPPLH